MVECVYQFQGAKGFGASDTPFSIRFDALQYVIEIAAVCVVGVMRRILGSRFQDDAVLGLGVLKLPGLHAVGAVASDDHRAARPQYAERSLQIGRTNGGGRFDGS